MSIEDGRGDLFLDREPLHLPAMNTGVNLLNVSCQGWVNRLK